VTIGKILAPVDGSYGDKASIENAVRIARIFHAHVAVLFAHLDPAEAVPAIGIQLGADVFRASVDANMKIDSEAWSRISCAMDAACHSLGATVVKSPERCAGVTISADEAIGFTPHVIRRAAILSDLVVFRPCKDSPQTFEAAVDVVLQSRRPVLLATQVPNAFRHIAIGWDESTAAMDAVWLAMPFLERADTVEIVCIERPETTNFITGKIEEFLNVRGIAHKKRHIRIAGSDPARSLADYACSQGADLLVMGGFGHGRIRETLLGGMTNEFLRNTPLPLFIAH